MKPEPELIEAILLVYIQSGIKNVIILHEEHVRTDFETCKEYTVFNKTLKERDIVKFLTTRNMYDALSRQLNEYSWDEIRFIFLQYKMDDRTYLKLKLRPVSLNESNTAAQWQVYGQRIPYFTFTADVNKDSFVKAFEQQLIAFLS
jgi:hypothetical protein